MPLKKLLYLGEEGFLDDIPFVEELTFTFHSVFEVAHLARSSEDLSSSGVPLLVDSCFTSQLGDVLPGGLDQTHNEFKSRSTRPEAQFYWK